jgi:cytochrome P450
MAFANSTSTSRLRSELPPSAPLPATLQTLACRWWPFAYLERCRERLGNRFTVYPINMPPLVFLSDPQDILAVTAAPPNVLHPGAGGTIMAPLFGEKSFVLREETEHLTGRNAITQAFHRRVVQEQSNRIAGVVVTEIASWPTETAFALQPYLRHLALKIILESALNHEHIARDVLHRRLLAMLSVMPSPVLQEPCLRHLPGWSKTWRTFIRQRSEVHETISALITRRRETRTHRGDMLDMLLAAQNPDGSYLSDQEIRDSFASVIIAGHETTAAQLGWAFQLLAHSPGVQERLADEIDQGKTGEYMTATIQETLRHGPVFLFAPPRAVVKPIVIGDWTYRPPAHLVGCIYLMHHDPDLYPRPHTFCPERFLGKRPQPGTLLPWGAGRKHCPGRHLALLVMRTVLQKVLSTSRVLPASTRIEPPRWRSAILTPRAGSRVVLQPRHLTPRNGNGHSSSRRGDISNAFLSHGRGPKPTFSSD